MWLSFSIGCIIRCHECLDCFDLFQNTSSVFIKRRRTIILVETVHYVYVDRFVKTKVHTKFKVQRPTKSIYSKATLKKTRRSICLII